MLSGRYRLSFSSAIACIALLRFAPNGHNVRHSGRFIGRAGGALRPGCMRPGRAPSALWRPEGFAAHNKTKIRSVRCVCCGLRGFQAYTTRRYDVTLISPLFITRWVNLIPTRRLKITQLFKHSRKKSYNVSLVLIYQ